MAKKEGKVENFKGAFRDTDFQQTKAKLKKGYQSLNLLRLFKLAALFMVSRLLTLCRSACPGSATSAIESSAVSTLLGATSLKLSNRGHSLTLSRMWKVSSASIDAERINGIEFTYSNDCCG